MNEKSDKMTNTNDAKTSVRSKSFLQYQLLSMDLHMYILSFIADSPFRDFSSTASEAPFESIRYYSTLTHVIPYLCKSIYERRDLLWREALIRNVKTEKFLWEPGILSFLINSGVTESKESTLETLDLIRSNDNYDYEYKLIHKVCELIHRKSQENISASTEPSSSSALSIYRNVVQNYLRHTGPVFHMPSEDVRLGDEFSLHFFEPRYRLLISEVMENWSFVPNGEVITPDSKGKFPSFIYANQSLHPPSPAMIVQVMRAHRFRDGRADVLLKPVAHVQLERVWERPNSRGLFMGRVIRVGEEGSRRIEESSSGNRYLFTGDIAAMIAFVQQQGRRMPSTATEQNEEMDESADGSELSE